MRTIAIAYLLLVAGCQMNELGQIDKLRELAVARVRAEMPDKVNDTLLPTMIRDKGDSWAVSFYWYKRSPPTPAPTIFVRKDDKAAAGQQLEQLRGIAIDYIPSNHPDWINETNDMLIVVDWGTYWGVAFSPDTPHVGGTPIVNIDKVSGRVIEALHTY